MIHLKCLTLFTLKKKKIRLSSTAIVIGSLKVKAFFLSKGISQTSIIQSARDCRNLFELSVVRISEIGSFRICSDFFIQYHLSNGNICLSIKDNELLDS